jgi:hypothetical protein
VLGQRQDIDQIAGGSHVQSMQLFELRTQHIRGKFESSFAAQEREPKKADKNTCKYLVWLRLKPKRKS